MDDHGDNSATLSGTDPLHCIAQVVKVNNTVPLAGYPLNANLASKLFYDVRVQVPGSGLIDGFKFVVPIAKRWPAPWIVEAFSKGEFIPATIMNGQLFLDKAEERWAAPCGWVPDTSGGGGDPPPGNPRPIITPGPVNPPITITPGTPDGPAPIRVFPRPFGDESGGGG